MGSELSGAPPSRTIAAGLAPLGGFGAELICAWGELASCAIWQRRRRATGEGALETDLRCG